ncbi:MAG: discoidin domain-containing protein, partial [Gammaproteobacteria bacterium]
MQSLAAVYRGATYPELSGRYLAGDYVTGKIWAITLDESSMTATKDEIASFTSIGSLGTWGQDNNGEVYLGNVAAQNDTLYQLQRVINPIPDPPALLSQTFAFTDLGNLQAANFFVPYTLNEPFWSDGALKKRWIALPNDGTRDTPAEQIAFSPTSDWVYPAGTVLMKHFELALDDTDPTNTTRLETRFLVLGNNGRWYGVTYRWRPDQSDADLLTTAQTQDYQITTAGGGSRTQTWLFPGRDQCLSCHSPGAGGAAGPRTHQINGDITYPSTGITDNQLRTWNHLGMFAPALDETAIPGYLKSAAKDDPNASLERRARSYLDVNCSYCHRPGTGNRAIFDMRFTTPPASQGLVYGAVIDNLGISGAYLITPGDTSTSIVFHRANTASPSPTAMPPLAKSLVDTAGMALLAEWIQGIDPTLYVNRALNRPVAASSEENAGLSAAAAVDGDSATRWSSAFSDPQSITVDLGAVYSINHVVLNWEWAYGKAYRIEVSTDGTTWNQVFSETNGNGDIDDIVFATTSARYVRLWGTVRGTPWGYSLYEFEVYGATSDPPVLSSVSVSPATATVASGSTRTFTATGLDQYGAAYPTTVGWTVSGGGTIDAGSGLFTATTTGGPFTVTATSTADGTLSGTAQVTVVSAPTGNLAQGRVAAASSVESAALSAANAVDGNASTRWSSVFSDPQWFTVDLGAVYSINHVVLNWEAAYGKAYKIQVSTDGTTWSDKFSETNGNGGTDDIFFGITNARYVRLWGTARGTPWGYSLYEFEVYGATDPPVLSSVSVSPAT